MNAPLVAAPADAFACEVVGLSAVHRDGRSAPLDKCVWAEIAPCGCVSGMTAAVHPDAVLRTPEAALRSMCPTASQYRESVKQGSRMVCVLDQDYRGDGPFFALVTANCPHTPKWGVALQTRQINGVEWTRIYAERWTARYQDKSWSIEKWSSLWHLSGPPQGAGRFRMPSLGLGKLDEALERASAYIAEHPDGLERAS